MTKPNITTAVKPAVRPAAAIAPTAVATVDGERNVVGEPVNESGPLPSSSDLSEISTPAEAPRTFIDVKGTYFTIVGDTSQDSHVIGMWDTALTVCGGLVFTPPTVDNKSDPSELELGDFAVNVKIRKSHYLIVIVDDSGEIPTFMFPWIDFAFARGKKVIIDQMIIPTIDQVLFRTNGLIKELNGFLVSREGFQKYTAGKLD